MQKTIVLDMDETLLHTFSDTSREEMFDVVIDNENTYLACVSDLDMHPGSGNNQLVAGAIRPGFDDFMRFCYNCFRNVIVWSAGTNNYVNEVMDEVCSNVGMPDLILTREDCVRTRYGFEKPLYVLVEDYPHLGITMESIVIVDDKEVSFRANPDNGVLMTPFEPGIDSLKDNDNSLAHLQEWLEEELLQADDVREVYKPIF